MIGKKLRHAMGKILRYGPFFNWTARAARTFLPRSVLIDPRFFDLWEQRGVHALPVQYYSPLPNLRALPDETWTRKSMLPGIDLDDEGQIKLLQSFSGLYRTEYDSLARDPAPGQPFYLNNYFFMAVDAQAAYCMVRHFRPARVIEVGSGFSTLLLAQALGANAGGNEGRGELTSVDPYPSSVLKRGPEDLTRLIQTPVQQLDPSFFKVLGPNDLLFIDSSHCLSMGSDVQHLYLEVIPRLKPGVLVHIHDIFWPYEYPRQWAHQMRWFFTEQYLLQALLCGNSSFKVRWSSSHMHAHHPDLLRAAFSSYDCPDCPLLLPPHSFWMQRTD